jgi:hypothetical protein
MKLLAAVAGVSLLPLTIAGAPSKPDAEECTITEGIISKPDTVGVAQPVVLGVVVGTWELTDKDGNDALLYLSESLLFDRNVPTDFFFFLDTRMYYGYYGKARALKRQGRFDFEFDEPVNGGACTSPGGDEPRPYSPPLCRYRLIIEDGVYDGQSDDVRFETPARVFLYDYTILREELEGRVQVPILIDFPKDDSGGGESESGRKRCTNDIDDDGDGFVDCDDSDCSSKKFCPQG